MRRASGAGSDVSALRRRGGARWVNCWMWQLSHLFLLLLLSWLRMQIKLYTVKNCTRVPRNVFKNLEIKRAELTLSRSFLDVICGLKLIQLSIAEWSGRFPHQINSIVFFQSFLMFLGTEMQVFNSVESILCLNLFSKFLLIMVRVVDIKLIKKTTPQMCWQVTHPS